MQGMFALFVDEQTIYLTKDDSAFTWLSRCASTAPHPACFHAAALKLLCSRAHFGTCQTASLQMLVQREI